MKNRIRYNSLKYNIEHFEFAVSPVFINKKPSNSRNNLNILWLIEKAFVEKSTILLEGK